MEEFGKLEERVVLVGVQTDDHDNVEESLDELKELASTAGAVTVGRIIQNRESVHPGTYIGKGKIEEVRALVYAMDATGIICDDELSPAQLNNLERELDCKVMDRTLLILDIFAARAITRSRADDEDGVLLRNLRNARRPEAGCQNVADKQRLFIRNLVRNFVQFLIGVGDADKFCLSVVFSFVKLTTLLSSARFS